MFRIVVAHEAWRDIDRLEDWLFERGATYANELGNHLANEILSLRRHPKRAPLSRDRRYREFYVDFHSNQYVVWYQVQDQGVVIGRIFHSREER